jgi:glutamine amidotransferase-like uncharacterized protein
LMPSTAIAIYTGQGSSHSWLWFADLFETSGFYDLRLLDEAGIRDGELKGLSVLAVSGGDTFAMAKGLGSKGAMEIETFVRGGGIYLGSCAGAYLPLRSSKDPLDLFNFVEARISNLTSILPEPKQLKEKFSQPYGCSFIFHPVREEVQLSASEKMPLTGTGTFPAPLYGGPAMVPYNQTETLASYTGFTDKTAFLVDPELARKTLIGKAAIIRKKWGAGSFYLLGPHLEHPRYASANKLVVRMVRKETREGLGPKQQSSTVPRVMEKDESRQWVRAVKREVSNARIVVAGIENFSLSWKIGWKTYEPLKMRVFLEAIWKRLKSLEQVNRIHCSRRGTEVVKAAEQITRQLRELKNYSDQGLESTPLAEKIFQGLRTLARDFLTVYFQTKKAVADEVKPSRSSAPAIYRHN